MDRYQRLTIIGVRHSQFILSSDQEEKSATDFLSLTKLNVHHEAEKKGRIKMKPIISGGFLFIEMYGQ